MVELNIILSAISGYIASAGLFMSIILFLCIVAAIVVTGLVIGELIGGLTDGQDINR